MSAKSSGFMVTTVARCGDFNDSDPLNAHTVHRDGTSNTHTSLSRLSVTK